MVTRMQLGAHGSRVLTITNKKTKQNKTNKQPYVRYRQRAKKNFKV